MKILVIMTPVIKILFIVVLGRYEDTSYNDTSYEDTSYNDNSYEDTSYNDNSYEGRY